MMRRWLIPIGAILAAAAAVGIGIAVYAAGYSNGSVAPETVTSAPVVVTPYGHGPWAFWPFPFFFVFPLFFLGAILLLRGAFWRGPRAGWRGCGPRTGPGAVADWDEWHRQQHQSEQQLNDSDSHR